MKVSFNWLQKHIAEQLPEVDKLVETITMHAFEVEGVEKKDNDTILDVDVLPNRAGDCLSHIGIAREIAGLLNLTLKQEEVVLEDKELALPVELQSDLCKRYIAIQIDGVKVDASPSWLQDALTALGQRSINNIVDATNYVLLDSGQPIHAFDRAKIDGGIVVRLAKEDEHIVTLSNEEKPLKPTDLVIADYIGSLAIAGVKGGKTAEVTEATSSIVVEVANFDPTSVRKTSRSLNLITDASKRFENNFSPELARAAAAQVVALIKEIAGGEVVGVKDVYPVPEQVRSISFSVDSVVRLLGSTVSAGKIASVFDRYGYDYKQDGEAFIWAVPTYRKDISGPHDIAEEVGRVIGFDTLPALMLPFNLPVIPNPMFAKIQAVRQYLAEQGFAEVITYAFRKKGDVYVAYGSKDKSALRTNLSDGLKESYELNRLNAPLLGKKDMKIFEIGSVFTKDAESVHVGTADRGTIQELPIEQFINDHGIEVTDNVPTPVSFKEGTFKPWSLFPFITRDIAVWVSNEDEKHRLEEIVSAFAAKYCAREAQLFDTFTKDGKTSVAYRFIFQSNTKTLTDEEVSKDFSVLIEEIQKDSAFSIR